MADWSELLPELLFEITKELRFYEDLFSFSNVCSSWQSVAADAIADKLHPSRFPSLMVAGEDEDNNNCQIFLLGSEGVVHKTKLPARNLTCRSSRGWLLTFEKYYGDAKLFHPLSGCQIDLPMLDTFGEEFRSHWIEKVVLSTDPVQNDDTYKDLIVMVICGRFLGFCRPGDSRWTCVTQGWVSAVDAICYHNNKAYTFDGHGIVRVCDVHDKTTTSPRMLQVSKTGIPEKDLFSNFILGFDDGRLLVVLQRGFLDLDGKTDYDPNRNDCLTKFFLIYECNIETGEWLKVENLGNRAIFVGWNSSFWVEASDCIKANCIYFTDSTEANRINIDMGIYHLSDGSIEPHFNVISRNFPMWLEPPGYLQSSDKLSLVSPENYLPFYHVGFSEPHVCKKCSIPTTGIQKIK